MDYMNTYEIVLKTDEPDYCDYTFMERWSGYDERVACSQAMLSHAQNGARSIEIVDVYEV